MCGGGRPVHNTVGPGHNRVVGGDGAGVGRLLVVVIAELGAGGGDVRGVVDAEGPAADIDRMNAVIAELAVSPVPEIVPVVRNDVIAIGLGDGSALPEVVVERGGRGRFVAVADRRPIVEVGGAGVEDSAYCAALHLFDHLAVHWITSPLQADLNHAVRGARGGDHTLAFVGGVAGGLFAVNVFSSGAREDRGRGVPMVGGGADEGVDVFVVERAAEVFQHFRGGGAL